MGSASRTAASSLCELLGIDLPLIQAPMAGVQAGALAAAVTNAGALGSLPAALLDAKGLRAELLALDCACGIEHGDEQGRRRRRRRGESGDGGGGGGDGDCGALPSYNVNFFVHRPPARDPQREEAWAARLQSIHPEPDARPRDPPPPASWSSTMIRPFHAEMAAVLAEFCPRVVSFHFGLPSVGLLAAVRESCPNVVVMSTATTVAEARWLRDHGADVIIAQGLEAGGHRGVFLPPPSAAASSDDSDGGFDDWASTVAAQMGTFALLPQVVAAVAPVPVVAAGGIADANGVAAALALGASGVQVGTAFLLCDEANTSAVHRRALLRRGRHRPSKASSSSSSPPSSSTTTTTTTTIATAPSSPFSSSSSPSPSPSSSSSSIY